MSVQTRLFSLLLSTSLALGAGAACAQDAHADHANMDMGAAASAVAAKQTRWSDPASWPSGKVPVDGDAVTIGRDKNILLDVAPPTLRSLTINGKLSFADDRDIALKTEWILLGGGELAIGSAAKPFTHQATITLTDTVPNEDVNTMGDRGIMMLAGTLNLHGNRTDNTWTKLAKTAKAGTSSIQVLNAAGWRKGDEIVLASTDFDPRQAERRTVTAISGNTLTLDKPLQYMHFGEVTFGVDERGEVGMLTRNIKIQASEDSDKNYFGGHIMAMAGSKMFVSSVELTRMGQNMHLARYPIHWHIIGDGQGQYIQNASIHDTYSRCVTVHGTNNLRIQNNVTYNTVGHCYFLEDGVETGNQFIHNLGIQTKCHPTKPCEPTNLTLAHQSNAGQKSKEVLLPSDNTASTFWITNPDNIYRDNVAAGSDEIGFWLALPQHPTGAHEGTEASKNIWPRRTQLREFNGNVSHSNFDGLMFDRGPSPDGTFSVGGAGHISYADPRDTKSQILPTVINNYTGYKNRNGAIWGRGEMHLFTNLRLADNAIGFTHASGGAGLAPYTTRVVDSIFVGESANIGNPKRPEEVAYGRSLPAEAADFPIRGYEYYDYRHDVVNTTFINYQPNDLRDAGALSYLLFTSFGMSTENSVEGLKFVNAKPVSFPPVQRRWASDFGARAAYRSAAFHDKDGSVSGTPGAYVVIDNGIASYEGDCTIKASWGAAICKGDMGRLNIGGNSDFPEFGNRPITEPVVLSRNGKRFEYNGDTTIGNGAEVQVETARKTLSLALREMDQNSFVIFELPGFSSATSGVQQDSLASLRAADKTSYFKDANKLWVKLVVEDANRKGPVLVRVGNLTAQTNIDVIR